ncbi:Pirin domain-containing protein [Gonapodya prolifera JEL478]|uniref:Pirin domain-containing protein n=1 Tax=Gonapodya prolifera (strain JEL478) TaxID=1344416 RepID=A0A139AUS1_GONPJ|nr:Pirin domain-containing protein [Gonapodya prolifera JEL478]|eukprot:KXS20486.1 Pirin domain-containing protein [Gonapodya prolifera JEL478]
MSDAIQSLLTPETSPRRVGRIFKSYKQIEGAGFEVRRPFPAIGVDHVDPFLLLDHFGPTYTAPNTPPVGAPDHPHRGFETVTYVLEGENEHKDSRGNSGKIGPGDVQWMTAGSGIVHSEMPSEAFCKTGGVSHGFQIWLNLPRTHKLCPPRYQDLPASTLAHPVSPRQPDLVRATVIAGSVWGAKGPVDTVTPVAMVHFVVGKGGVVEWGAKDGEGGDEWTVVLYISRGRGMFGPPNTEMRGGAGDALLMRRDLNNSHRDTTVFWNEHDADEELEVILLAGKPLNEPVARYGPFVMNTREELVQAFEDYRSGKMGAIEA